MTNLIAGFGQYIDMARGSLAETQYLLEFSESLGYIETDASEIKMLVEDVGKLLWSFQKSL